jgi:hypothetical protein
LWFTDILGFLKSFTITPSELEEALGEAMGFDGSSIEGFARIEESDMIAKPDPTTPAGLLSSISHLHPENSPIVKTSLTTNLYRSRGSAFAHLKEQNSPPSLYSMLELL